MLYYLFRIDERIVREYCMFYGDSEGQGTHARQFCFFPRSRSRARIQHPRYFMAAYIAELAPKPADDCALSCRAHSRKRRTPTRLRHSFEANTGNRSQKFWNVLERELCFEGN